MRWILIPIMLLWGCENPVGQMETGAPEAQPMVRIPAGPFTMGSDEYGRDEEPAHQVFLDAYLVDQFEVTNRAYELFVQKTWHRPAAFSADRALNGDSQPVVGVNWFDAGKYCRWAGKRLCTEAEWEKAARGTDGRVFPWGDAPPTAGRLNFNGLVGHTVSVGSYPDGQSPHGLYDMSGNVWEWVSDWFRVDYYKTSPVRNPHGPDSGGIRVYRGGGWTNGIAAVRANERGRLVPQAMGPDIGFRCCRDDVM